MTPPDVRENLCHLRHFGIRTATDLIQVYKEALRRGGTDAARRRAEVELLLATRWTFRTCRARRS